MKLEDYMDEIRVGRIPAEPPDVKENLYEYRDDEFLALVKAREECVQRGTFIIVDQIWTRKLAQWIGKRKVLEIMAGKGWLAKALSEQGVDIIATDNGSWFHRKNSHHHSTFPDVFLVEKLNALSAIKRYGGERDLLLVSWPYMDKDIFYAAKLWDSISGGGGIIYIGEGKGGCTACDEFFAHFSEYEDVQEFPLKQWCGYHDSVRIGFYDATE
jgi:hypothetical protein